VNLSEYVVKIRNQPSCMQITLSAGCSTAAVYRERISLTICNLLNIRAYTVLGLSELAGSFYRGISDI
jgi:hypothetical protein